jgi:hypothetical protein
MNWWTTSRSLGITCPLLWMSWAILEESRFGPRSRLQKCPGGDRHLHATRNGDPRSMNTGDLEFAKAGTGPSVSDMGRLTGKPPLEGAVRGGRVRVDRSLPRLCQATVARSADSSDRAIGPSEPRNTRGPFHLIHGRGLYLCLRSIMHIDLPGHTRHAWVVHG